MRDAFLSLRRDGNGVTAVVSSSHAARAARGHFPGAPLLPGSALLDLMERAARTLRPAGERLTGVERVLFRRRVHPGDRIVVTATPRDPARVAAAVLANGAEAAAGTLRFGTSA